MRLGLIALSATLVACPVLAEDYESPVVLPDGAVIEVTIANTREVPRMAAPVTVTSRYRQTLKRTDDGYRVTQRLTGIEAPPAIRAALDRAMAGQEEIVYDASEDLAPVRIVDYDALIGRIMEGVRKLAGEADSVQLQGMIEGIQRLYAGMGPEQGAASILKTNNMSAATQAVALDVDKPVEGEAGIPNPFGGPPLRQIGRMTLESVDKAAGKAVIVSEEFLDPETTKGLAEKMIAQLLPSLEPEEAAKLREVASDLTFERTLSCRSEMDVKTGLATATDCTSTTSVPDGQAGIRSRTERWQITQKVVRP